MGHLVDRDLAARVRGLMPQLRSDLEALVRIPFDLGALWLLLGVMVITIVVNLLIPCSAAFLTPISAPGSPGHLGRSSRCISAAQGRRIDLGAPSLAASARYRSVLRVAASSDRVNSDEMSTLLSIEPFEVSESREASRVRVSLRGELDLATADEVADHLRGLRERHDTVVLDLEGLTFIDAAGVRVILRAAQDAQNDGWGFTVTRGSGVVRRVFELLDLDQFLRLDGEAS